jgi:hypothetical protein
MTTGSFPLLVEGLFIFSEHAVQKFMSIKIWKFETVGTNLPDE